MAKWRKVKLADLCKFVRGPFGGSLKKDIFVSQGYAVFEQQHAIYGDFNNFRYFVTKDKFNEMQRFKLSPGDLIMSCSGTLGKVTLVPEGIPNGIINQALLKLTPTDEVEGRYIKSWFESDLFTQSLKQNSGGAAIQNVAEVRLLKEIQIHLPPLAEQRKIAEILRTWDEAIETAEAELKAKQERKRWLMDKLLRFGTAGPSELSANGEPVPEGAGAVMLEFNTAKLETVGSFQNGEAFSSAYFNFEKKGLRLVRNRDLKNDDQIVYYDGEYTDHDVVNDGDLLVGMDGDFAPVIWKKGKALLNQRVGRVLINDGASKDYIYYALFSALAELEHVTSATTVKHLSSKTCLGLEIPLPTLAEQRKIAEILQAADVDIELINNRTETLRTQKRGLMQKLLTGEIRLAV
jgi:type I restriction enzyme, S subunit